MTHLTASTSINAYKKLDASSLYEAILSQMRKIAPQSVCISDLATTLHMERSTVSARLNELKNMGSLAYDGKRKSKRTGITSMHWRIKTNETLF